MVYSKLDKASGLLARAIALTGGAVLLVLVVMTCLSITGRSLTFVGLNQVHGDFEWMEFGVGFAIFCFLPLAQYSNSHARVDLLAGKFPPRFNQFVDFIADMFVFAVASVIAWRLTLGMLDKKSYGETSFILQFPIWITYALGLVGMIAFVLISMFCILRSWRKLTGNSQ